MFRAASAVLDWTPPLGDAEPILRAARPLPLMGIDPSCSNPPDGAVVLAAVSRDLTIAQVLAARMEQQQSTA
jgi:hypothetical protein